ncbi:unnamed protein product [Diamesa serratosioi]
MDLSDENPLTPLASETNKFWTTYNYLMDTNLIDSCHNKQNTPPKEPEIIAKSKFSTLDSVPNSTNQPFRSQRLSHESLRRLRRWLNEMEKRFALAPTLSDAMKLNKKELQRYLTVHADLYKEIVSRERAVAFCIRSITDCHLFESTATILDQHSSLKSDSSEKDNNLGKALQRRYHLLYLKAIEVQCMLEGLLEKRKKIQSMAMSMNSSDEEPHHKIAKYKHKSNGKEVPIVVTKNSLMTDTSSGNETGHNEGSDSVNEFEISSLSSIVQPLFSDTSSGFENAAEISTSIPSLKSDTLTNFHHSNRKSMNCGTFYYKFEDNESEKMEVISSVVTETTKSMKSTVEESIVDCKIVCNEINNNNTLLINTWDFLKTPEKIATQLPFEFVTPRMDTSENITLKSLTAALNDQSLGSPMKTLDSSSESDDNNESMKKLRKRRKKLSHMSSGSEPKKTRTKETNSTRTNATQIHVESPNVSVILNTSSISEPEWDDYFKNYDTDIFSDSDDDAVKYSLEFGNDYREFLDSVSESCTSLPSVSSVSLTNYREKFEKQLSDRMNIKRIIDECEPMHIDANADVRRRDKIRDASNNMNHLSAEDYAEIVEICRKNVECLERVLKNSAHERNYRDSKKECDCARITRFIAFCLDFILDFKNYITSTTLYKFLSTTVRSFFALIKYVRRKAESFVDRLCRRLATF